MTPPDYRRSPYAYSGRSLSFEDFIARVKHLDYRTVLAVLSLLMSGTALSANPFPPILKYRPLPAKPLIEVKQEGESAKQVGVQTYGSDEAG